MDQLNKWLTLIANFGVVAGLFFLGVEIRQNTTALHAAAIQESTNIGRTQILTLATDAELNRLVMSDFDELSPEEQQRVFYLDRSFWFGMQGQYRQWKMGVLPDPDWSTWLRIICGNFKGRVAGTTGASAGNRLWEGNRNTLIPEFIEFVETSCSAGLPNPGISSVD